MAFKKREIKSDNVEQNESESIVDNRTRFVAINGKTYKEEAIEVLNLLEAQGVDIYDPDRYGGMYLKRKDNGQVPENIKQLFNKNSKKSVEINNSVTEEKPENLQNLFNFFNNKKK